MTTILDEAAHITSDERRETYGHPRDNFGTIAALWSAYVSLSAGGEIAFSARDVAVMSLLIKVARDAHAPNRDNLVDIAGYARTAEMLEEADEQPLTSDNLTTAEIQRWVAGGGVKQSVET